MTKEAHLHDDAVLARAAAALTAGLTTGPGTPEAEVLARAARLAAFIEGGRLTIRPGAFTYRQASADPPRQTTITAGGKVQIKDSEQFSISVEVDDSKGFAVSGDALTYTTSDPAVVSLQPSADGFSCLIVGGNPGSAVVTVSDGTICATEAVDVVPGDAATFKITEGAAEPQPPGRSVGLSL